MKVVAGGGRSRRECHLTAARIRRGERLRSCRLLIDAAPYPSALFKCRRWSASRHSRRSCVKERPLVRCATPIAGELARLVWRKRRRCCRDPHVHVHRDPRASTRASACAGSLARATARARRPTARRCGRARPGRPCGARRRPHPWGRARPPAAPRGPRAPEHGRVAGDQLGLLAQPFARHPQQVLHRRSTPPGVR
jgi:hypothetical protein